MRVSGARTRVLLCLVLLFSAVTSVLGANSAYAAQITARSLQLKKNATVVTGGSAPNALADHLFAFTTPTAPSVGSIKFQYCTTASGTCTMPTGLVTTSATIGSQSFSPVFTMVNTTNGSPYLTRTASSLSAAAYTVQLNTITNPTAANATFFVRITTFTSTTATTGASDTGTVAASTTQTITVTGTMPEYLSFCTGGVITVTANIPICGSATSGAITFDQEFSPSDTSAATSMMAASTNAASGYVITATGTTLTSGANTIPTIGTSALAANTSRGTSKFGINLVANTSTAAGFFPGTSANINPTSNGTNLRGLAAGAYSTADSFALDLTGATAIAKSDNTTPGTPAATDGQAFTVSYIANVSGIQAPGSYVATINYVCTPTF